MQRTKFCGLLHSLVIGLLCALICNQVHSVVASEPSSMQSKLVAEFDHETWHQGEVIPLTIETRDQVNLLVAHNESTLAKPLAPYDERPIESLGIDIGRTTGQLPINRAVVDQVYENASTVLTHRSWPISTRTWVASKTRHRPLYFEEINAERYGYTRSRTLQPAISTAHFFGTIPMLPYLMAADGPCKCNYTLGHYRPGSCNPYQRHRWPRSLKGVGVEGAVAVGMIALIP